ncbi:MAG TPA: hypothetical protein VD971_00470 [Phycisphaerales bacterium]|nr:hypothetical protein [Phycisphaerales bacterium]
MRRALTRLRIPWRLVCFFLAAGVILTVATAWECVLLHTGSTVLQNGFARDPRKESDGRHVRFRRSIGVVYVQQWAPWLRGTRWSQPEGAASSPWWPAEATESRRNFALAAGWPMPALLAVRVQTPPSDNRDRQPKSFQDNVRWGVLIPVNVPQRWREFPLILPLRPMWPGFAVNTLLYAAAIGGACAAWRSVRAWRRRTRGLCARCAYPVVPSGAVSACPECGEPYKAAHAGSFAVAPAEASTGP